MAFQSPAQNYRETRLNLGDLVSLSAYSTYLMRSDCDIPDAGIVKGSVLAIDRALTPAHGQLIVAEVDGELTLRRLLLTPVPALQAIGIYTSSNGPRTVVARRVSSSGVYSDNSISVFSNTDNPANSDGALSIRPRFCCRPDNRHTQRRARALSSPSARCSRHASTHAMLAISSRRSTASALR